MDAMTQIPIMKRRWNMMKNSKYRMIGLVLTISMLLTFSTLNAATAIRVENGVMTLNVYMDDSVNAYANGNGGSHRFSDNSVTVVSEVNVYDLVGNSSYYFYINVTNLNTSASDDNEYDWGDQGYPTTIETTIEATVPAGVNDYIEVYIYCSITHGSNFDDEDDTYLLTFY